MVRGRRARFFRLFRFSILHISPGPLPPPPPPCQLPRDSLYYGESILVFPEFYLRSTIFRLQG